MSKKVTKTNTKTKHFTVNLSAVQDDLIIRASTLAGELPSVYIRMCAIETAKNDLAQEDKENRKKKREESKESLNQTEGEYEWKNTIPECFKLS